MLRKLAEVLEDLAPNDKQVTALSTLVFHPEKAKVGSARLPSIAPLLNITGNMRRVIEQACGSQVTYVWGPPGTGKTYSIAHLILSLIESGERVLVASHTHTAVNQILYETIKSDGGLGPLATHSAVSDGEVIRIGITKDPKIPNAVRLDKIVEAKAIEISEQISDLETQIAPLVEARARASLIIADWDKLTEVIERRQILSRSSAENEHKLETIELRIKEAEALVLERHNALNRAQQAWLRRAVKTARAATALREAEMVLQVANADKNIAENQLAESRRLLAEIHFAIRKQKDYCDKKPVRAVIQEELTRITRSIEPFEQQIKDLQGALSRIEQNVIDAAQVVFCTLTKMYTGRELEDQSFDAVIIDEISMALPPLVFLCAGRAESRVILVGDFLQLPPIVRSDTPMSNARLATDTFHLAREVKDMKPALVVLCW